MREYDKQKPLIFIHVPKTGGTSLRSIFECWFQNNFHQHYINQKLNQKPQTETLGPAACVYGHFNKSKGLGVGEQYPDVNQFVTVLRDPFEAMVSHYYYVRKVGGSWLVEPPPLRMTLEEYVSSAQPGMMKHLPFELALDNYRQLLERHFIHIGVTEQISASIACMAKKLSKDEQEIPTLNVTERPRHFSPSLRADFRARNPLAYAIYEFALENNAY